MKKNYSFNDSRPRRKALSCIKKIFPLLRGITSKHDGGFYGLSCHHLFRTKNKFESHKKVCENKDFCNVAVLSKHTKILEFNQYCQSDKTPFIIYPDLQSFLEKIDDCKINSEKSSATKVSDNIPSGFPISII